MTSLPSSPAWRLTAAALLLGACVAAHAHQSNPGATHTLLVDFGAFTSSADWPYRPGQAAPGDASPHAPYHSPPLFESASPEGFSADEQADFEWRIWRRVAEDYAPFDVNVITEAPPGFQALMDAGVAARVAVGGTSMDLQGSSGLAPPSGYLRPELDRNAFARARQDDGSLRTVAQIASTVSHEAAHLYGAAYHYADTAEIEWQCRARDFPGLREAHLSRFENQDRDGWWSDVGIGMDDADRSTCGLRGDVGVLRSALGRRQPLAPYFSENPLQASTGSSWTLVGDGVIVDNQATYAQEAFIEWLKVTECEQYCAFIPPVVYRLIGLGPDSWLFQARQGPVHLQVNTINGERYPGSPTRVDPTSADLDADFSLWMLDGGMWQRVLQSADRQAGDRFSAEFHYQVPHTELRTYALAVRSRGDYASLGQYHVEVRASNGNVAVYSPAKQEAPLPDPESPETEPVVPVSGKITLDRRTFESLALPETESDEPAAARLAETERR